MHCARVVPIKLRDQYLQAIAARLPTNGDFERTINAVLVQVNSAETSRVED